MAQKSAWAHSRSTSLWTLWYTGHPHCLPHNHFILAQHYRHCWPINLNAMLKSCLIVFTDSSLQQTQRPHSFNVEGLEEGHISDRSSEFLLYRCTLWVSHSKSQIPYDYSHCSFQWPDASQIKSTPLWNDNKKSLLTSHAACLGQRSEAGCYHRAEDRMSLRMKGGFVPLPWSHVAFEGFPFNQLSYLKKLMKKIKP